jgi:hypothetical protein
MRRMLSLFCVLVPPFFSLPLGAAPAAKSSVGAAIETTLSSEGEHIRQFAFDGEDKTYFASEKNAGEKDHFTLVLNKPTAVRSLRVTTGRPDGGDKLDAGTLTVSADGKTFKELAKFRDGVAEAKPAGRKIQAIRIKPTQDLKHPLVVREIVLDSTPSVAVFKYPVEFTVDVSDAPEMKEWATRAARICEQQYTMINEELKDDRYQPPRRVSVKLKKMDAGVAASVSGDRITASVTYFKQHPEDFGAMVHETVHVVQNYRVPDNPGWLVEGIADYIRFFKYEPGNLGPIDARRAHFDSSYRVTAAFLAYVTVRYDKQIVRKLNKIMREGEYKNEAFRKLTGKTLEQLDAEWRARLGASRNAKSRREIAGT